MEDEVTDSEVLLETFRQTRAVKWLLAVLVGFVVLVVAVTAVSAYRDEQERKNACASIEETLDQPPAGASPALSAIRAELEQRYRQIC